MITLSEEQEKEFKKTKYLAIVFLVIAPLIYICLVSFVLQPSASIEVKQEFIFYILIILSIFQPIAYTFIGRIQISNYKNSSMTGMTTEKLYTTLSIIKFSFVESIYIYGLVEYFLSGDKFHFMIFVVIAMCWSVFVWPKKEKFEKFFMKVESYGK